MVYDIIIIGAGASGLAAAYKAVSSNSKLNILVLEKETVPGRKLSAAGNGKCNLTNRDFHAGCYHSADKEFIAEWTGRHTYQEILDFFEEIGILLYQNNGYFYPLSNQGRQVTNLLYEKVSALGVRFSFETRVSAVSPAVSEQLSLYRVEAVTKEQGMVFYQARHLVLAAGGMAAPKLGGCQDGYALAKKLKLKERKYYPVLSPVYVEDRTLALAKGVRLDAAVTLKGKDGFCMKESGQVQFNDKSISGIVIMNLSCYLNQWKEDERRECIHIDTLPGLTWERLREFIVTQKGKFPGEPVSGMLSGILPKPFVKYIMRRLRMDNDLILKNLTDKQMNQLTSSLKKLSFTPVFYEDYDKAQVTGGGIATGEIEVSSFECKRYRNLYITGELLDVTGKCGGYNLTFAILSGIQAAKDIVGKYKR